MNKSTVVSPIVFETWPTSHGKLIGYVCLNLPQQLNALSLTMIDRLLQQLQRWQVDDDLVCVVFDGAGEKAFCAGGDVRKLYAEGLLTPQAINEYVTHFFQQEYELDHLIHHFTKPILVWGDGIVMGGGLGLMAGASHRIVTETTRLSMPEITIGLYPDVGAGYFLNQMPIPLGLFLGLTAYVLNGAEAVYVGLADCITTQDQKKHLFAQLKQLAWQVPGTVANHICLTTCLDQLPAPPLLHCDVQTHQAELTRLLAPDSLVEVENNVSAWQPKTPSLIQAKTTLLAGSPLSKGIVWQQLHPPRPLSLAEVFRQELILSVNCIAYGDFIEGVRALLIDKDKKPIWQVPTVADITAPQIARFFQAPAAWGDRHPLAYLD
ncbi:MAG: enoyl-CoA hydratase/isomerase family protein [Shewanellaceae bacterium]|nr:enoyl-CoA hydratase/isomerase family protein [Shewanellaceae bacterium]